MKCGMGLGIDKYYIQAKCENCPFTECYEPEVRKLYLAERKHEKRIEKLRAKKGVLSAEELSELIMNTDGLQDRVGLLKKQLCFLGYKECVSAFELYEPHDYYEYYHEEW